MSAPARTSPRTHAEKAAAFRALHARPGAFVIPTPWDAGTARLLASLGFEALATTSLGLANMLGRADSNGTVSAAEIIENARIIAGATDLPVNADLENGYADAPEAAAQIIRRAAEAGVVGASIEDYAGEGTAGIYDFALAVERVQAAVEMARSLPVPVMLTARAENLIRGRIDLDDTIRRLQAFEGPLQRSLRTAMMPILNAMAVAGVVSLPGMMTGQILAGADPVEAAKYQIMIMFALSGATALAVLLAALGGTWLLTDDRQRLRLDRLRTKAAK